MRIGALPVFARRRFRNERDWREAPECEHGTWTFAGADFKNRRTKWRCPTGQCQPKSIWQKADRCGPLVPRGSKRFGTLYAGRTAVEREFGRLKHEYGLAPLRTRGLARVQLHADLVMLARLSQALARARAVTLAA
jgi:Transposase DDE domain